MARLKLDIPENFQFSFEEKVRISDINYGGHVGNDAFLSVLHEARVQFFKSFGWTELDLAGIGTIMADSALIYKGEGFHGDRLLVEVTTADIHRIGFDVYYRITNIETKKVLLEAKTSILCFDYGTRKLVPLPQEVADKFQPTL
jgi:acyl-CoA thioester hydrolase